MARPRRDDRRLSLTSTDARRRADRTVPTPIAVCQRCRVDDTHRWAEVDAERFGAVVLRRAECVCHRCGRCDARIVYVDLDRG